MTYPTRDDNTPERLYPNERAFEKPITVTITEQKPRLDWLLLLALTLDLGLWVGLLAWWIWR